MQARVLVLVSVHDLCDLTALLLDSMNTRTYPWYIVKHVSAHTYAICKLKQEDEEKLLLLNVHTTYPRDDEIIRNGEWHMVTHSPFPKRSCCAFSSMLLSSSSTVTSIVQGESYLSVC